MLVIVHYLLVRSPGRARLIIAIRLLNFVRLLYELHT
jgi:hypothetical protein